MSTIVIIVGVLLIMGGVHFYSSLKEKERRASFKREAEAMGLSCHDRLLQTDEIDFNVFPLASRGRSQESTNSIVADSGELRMVVFDFKYVTGSGKNKSVHRQSVMMASSDRLHLPEFTLTPESFWQRFAEFMTGKDIDFEEDPEFSKAFYLRSPSEQNVRNYMTPARRHALLKYPQVYLEARFQGFILYHPRSRLKVEEVKTFMEDALGIYAALLEE
ncbi:hypothetical protein [Aureliella helgolandensis]|uniref:DUF3137 domain-containing protein n=1 Tax=Aureliella helgolandensis TaxID=2527968 RepID=A0A518GHH1_9BACT|nr:hypothetical protein [Aureliella helgolandensis]QDV28042.1 hypothetical protein Q31a_64350 [Aureliella helgolandensis]